MSFEKKRVSFGIGVLVMLVIFFLAMPQEIKAASESPFVGIGADTEEEAPEVWVYNGAKNFYAGDCILYYTDGRYDKCIGYLSLLENVSYKSSNTAVADIDGRTGKITTKKNGITCITITYEGQSQYFRLRVTDKKKIDAALPQYVADDADNLDKDAKIFINTVGEVTGIRKSNRYKILSAFKSYKYVKDYERLDNYNVWAWTGKKHAYLIYSSEAVHVRAICESFKIYMKNRSAFSGQSSNCLKVKSILGKGNTRKITINLSRNVTENQILGANYAFSWDTEIRESKNYTFPIVVQDSETKYQYCAIAKMKQGSNKITVEIQNLKLKKGTTYRLITHYGDWLKKSVNKNTFKAS